MIFATAGLDSIALRIPKSKIMQNIISEFKKPIGAPSANESGYISTTDATHVVDSFGNKIDLIIDSGRTDFGLESTIIDMTTRPYLIKRLGVIDKEMITKKTGLVIESIDKEDRPNQFARST